MAACDISQATSMLTMICSRFTIYRAWYESLRFRPYLERSIDGSSYSILIMNGSPTTFLLNPHQLFLTAEGDGFTEVKCRRSKNVAEGTK
jgi:hypothetical protein